MRRRSMAVAGVAVLATVLGACSGGPEQPEASPPPEQLDLEREPQPDGDPLPEVPVEDLWLPYQVDQLALVEPPWPAASVQELGGVLLAPAESEGALEFRAVDAEGTTLWWAQRPPSCTGFVLTTTGEGQDLAVLADLQASAEDSSEAVSTTVSGYDLHTGEEVWGPVDVPGPHLGPGLVFAQMPEQLGEPTGAVALDADTGEPLEVPDDARVVGEYGGTVLTVDDGTLSALAPGDQGGQGGQGDQGGLEPRWQVPVAEHGWSAEEVAAVAGTRPGTEVALLEVGTDGHALVSLADGEVLAEGVRDAATDAATGTVVLLDEQGLHGIDADGADLWSAGAGPEAEIQAVGGALVYLVDDGEVRAHNVLTGEVATAYDSEGSGELAIPELIAPTGAVLLTAGDDPVLATTRPADPAAVEEPPADDQAS